MSKKIFVFSILLGLCFSFNTSFSCAFTIYEPPEVTNNGYTSYPKITQLENIILKKTYENEDIEQRLERLEKKACARTHKGSDLAWRVDNLMGKIDQSELYNIPSKELASIEKKILGKSYKKDNINNRLARLEYKMLGASQSGKIDERYQTILTASNHYMDFGNSISNPLTTFTTTSIPSTSGIKTAFKNAFNTIRSTGSITGYTPPISPYGFNTPYGFNPQFGTFGPRNPIYRTPCPHHHRPHIGINNSRYTPHYSSTYPQHNTGYYNFNNNFTTGMGVHILD